MTDVYGRVSGEQLANTTLTGNQSEPRTIGLEGGGYVVVWTDLQGTTNQECRGQVFDNDGNKVGGEFLINTDTTGNEFQPKVAALEGGGFVVSFTDSNGDGAGNTGIRLQMFDATGNKVGGEFSANATATGNQTLSSVAGLPGGGFVALWMDANNSGDVVARIFDSAGVGGAEFVVNTNVINSQRDAVATALSDGNFVVTWTDSASSDVRAQIMTAAGTKVGGEFAVATNTTGSQGVPSITALKDGGFVVTWEDYSGVGDTSQSGIKGQVFDDNGTRVGSEFVVNATTYYFQQTPSVAALESGGFVVTWLDRSGIGGDTQDSGSNAVKAQVFNADGTRDGIEFLVNTTTAQNQWLPTVAGLTNGGFAISWVDASATLDNTGYGVVTQVFAPSDGSISDIVLTNTTVAEAQAENTIVGTLSANGPVTVARELTYTIVSDSTGGAFGIKDDKLVVADNARLDFETAPSATITIEVRDADGNSYQETFSIGVTDVASEVRWHAGNDIAVNTTTGGDQWLQAMAALEGGGYVITWTDASATGGDTTGQAIRGQRFDDAGHKVGGEFLVNTTTAGNQTASSVIGTVGGGFLVVWQDGSATPNPIRGQFFDADGDKVGLELQIDDGAGSGSIPEVILLNSGNFLVVWQDSAGDTGASGTNPLIGIRGQLIDAAGTKVGTEFTLNTQMNAAQGDPAIATTATGFVAVWTDANSSGVIRAQFFDNNGGFIGGEFQVNTQTAMNQVKPTATVLANGDVLFTWWDLSNVGGDTQNGGIKGQLYTSAGVRIGGEFLMNTTVDRDQDAPRVTALADGGFVLVFEDRSEYMLGNIRAQQFDAAGNKVGGEWIANYDISYAQKVPTIVQLENGDLAIAWYSGKNIGGDPLGWDVMTRVISPAVAGTDPVANADSLSAATDVATTFAAADLLGNDTHSFGTLSIQSVTAGTGGTVVLNPDGSVTFTSSAGFEGDAAFTYVVTDGEGGTGSATVTVDVAIPDLTPVHSGLPSTIYTAEDEPVGLNGGFAIDPPPSWISDSDSATITTTLTTTSGTFSISRPGGADVTGDGTGTVTITGTVADVNAAVYFASYNPAPDVYGTREITVTTSDAHSSASNTIQVEIAPMHDAPAGADVTVTATEDTPYTLRALDFGFSDIDGDSLAQIVLTTTPLHGRIVDLGGYLVEEDVDGDGDPELIFAAPMRDLEAGDTLDLSLMALGYIVYIPEADASGAAADSFTYQVVDNGGVPGSPGTVDLTPNTVTFDITGENDGPNLAGLATAITVSENDTALIDADVTFTDPEGNFDGGTLTVSGLLADDTVSFQDQGTGPGQIGASGGDVTYQGVVIGAWSGGAGGTFTVTFNAAATSAAIDALIESLAFGNTSDTPVASRDLTVTVTDDLGESISRTVTVDVTAVNDAPVNTVPADGAITGYAYTPIAITGLAVTDADADSSAIITVNILAGSGTLHVAEGVAGGGTVLGNDSGLVVLSGTLSEVNATLSALDGVTLTSGAGTINVTLTANDGGSSGTDPDAGSPGFEQDEDTFTVEVLNHAPTVSITDDYSAVGAETQVNTFTSGLQFQPDVAALEGGGYVVTWTSANQDGSSYGIYSQRFDDAGTALGGEVRVNSMVSGGQQQPAVAALADGGYVVTWTSENGDGSGLGVFAQRYDASGTPLGSETQINATSSLDQTGPSVTGLADGSFVVTWQSNLQDGSGFGIYARRFDAGGNAMTGEVLVNTATGDNQMYPVVTGLAGGGYVVTWQSYHQDGSDWGLYAQRYDSAGDPAGGEVRVNTTTAYDQITPSVTALADGGYVVTWASDVQDGSWWGIYSQRYDSDGNAVGGETQVNTFTTSDQMAPSVSALADGGYVVTWASYGQDSSGFGVYSQRYDSSGNAVGGETRVNTEDLVDQDNPVVVGLANGGYAVVWTSLFQDGDMTGVFTQSFADPLSAVEQVALDLKGTIAVTDGDAPDVLTVTLSVDFGVLDVTAGTSGATVTDSGTSTVTITGTAAQIQALLDSDATSTVSFTADDDAPPASASLTVTVDDGIDQATASHAIAITAVNDAPEIELDYFEPPVTSWTEGDGPVALTHGAIFDDDNDDFDGAVLTVSLGGATSGDQLTIETGFGLDVSGNDLIYDDPVDGPTVVGTLSGGDDGNPLTITFNENACHCAVELAMASIQYDNTDDLTVPSTRTVEITLVDGGGTALGGTDTGSDSFVLDVLPEAQVVAGAAAVGDEDTPIALTGVAIDSLAADPASDVIVVTLHVEHGALDIRDDVSGGLAAGDIAGIGTDTLVLTGTQDAINATLAASGGLTYQGDTDFSGADALAIEAHLVGGPSVPFAFSSIGALPAGTTLVGLELHDMNGDGLDEIAVGAPGALLLIGAGGGGALPLPDGGIPFEMEFADFDGDGITDIAFSVDNSLLNSIEGNHYLAVFSSLAEDIIQVADVPSAMGLTAGDFNGDGLMDLATTDGLNGRVAIVLQDPLGGFADPIYTASTADNAWSIVSGDFNGDNVLDLLVGNYGPRPWGVPGSIDLMLGNGDGTFAAANRVLADPSGNNYVGQVITADFNGDGALDIAFTFGNVGVMLGNGDGTFGAPVGYQTGTSSERLVAADFNGDGVLDIAVTDVDVPGGFSVLEGNGDGSFEDPVQFPTVDYPFSIAAGDADGDGDIDLVIGNMGPSGSILDFLNNDTDNVFHQITGSKDITVNPVDDDAVAVDDPATVAADDLVTIAVLANDSDVDGPVPLIATVNGVTLTAGQTTTLASGAVVRLLADGTLTYDPDGNFDWLVSPATALATGASNGSATDVFTYTLAGGASATVTVTVLGVDEPGDELLGTPAGDTITGTAGNDVIRAFGDVDLISGGDGNDTIWGNDDGDTLAGDAGNDRIYGGNGDDLLQGGEGNDTLIGNLGDDTLAGGLGDDVYYVGQAGDTVVENLNQGFDTVRAQIDYTLTDNVEELFIGGAARSGTGNALDNVLHGSDSSNTLAGLAGADVLRGSGGRDLLVGGAGEDLLDGGVGKDTLTGGAERDVFQFRDGDMGASRPLADLITDFSQADREKIQLNLVDANVNAAGNQAFAFVGTAAFSGAAGELRYEHALGNTWVSADVDGDGAADWYIGLTGTHTLVSGDFVL